MGCGIGNYSDFNQIQHYFFPPQGFIAAISPFNFTAIGVNLAGSPAMAGNVVLWKPSDTAMLSGWLVYKILRESGLPEGTSFFSVSA